MSRTKVFQVREGSVSLKGTVPVDIVSGLKLKDGDELDWELVVEDGKIIAKVRKAG